MANQLEAIAIIGFSMRFPQEATSPEEFWKILYEGRSVMTEVPQDRFNINGFYHPDSSRPDTVNCRGGHFLKDDLAAFDAPFFSMSPSEVECLDPQQRCLLETSYHAFENAGVPIQKAAGSKTSVYVGCLGVDYNRFFDSDEEIRSTYKATGVSSAILSNRLSWFYDLRGPSITLETACSSSMVALHLACQSLLTRESTMSLVCGSSLYLEPLTSAIPLSTMKFMSPDSRCYSFDDRGNGYAKGEGFGVLVLKPLKDAIAAGDTIRAVIRSTATNQDGRTPGITQPSQAAQEDQIREAYQRAGLDLSHTRLFESHGTGTMLGDRIEAEAIRAVFQESRSREDPIFVGAVKTNIGHLEATAGIAGIIKVLLCLEKGIIPPNAGFETLNRSIQAEEWHLKFPTKPVPWPTNGLRRASVNSFGYGGSNAHVIIDDAYNYMRERHLTGNHCTVEEPPHILSNMTNGLPSKRPLTNDRKTSDARSNGSINLHRQEHHNGLIDESTEGAHQFVFVWSGSDSGGIERLGSVYKDHLPQESPGTHSQDYLRNLAYTLSSKRSALPWKSYIVADSVEDLQKGLLSLPKPVRSSTIPKIHFIFTGQGAQWAEMGVGLMDFPEFERSIIDAESHFKHLGCSWSLIEEMRRPAEFSRLDDPALAQPICTALQVALAELLAAWNIHPCGVVGHSSGEIAAAFCAGAISKESAWTISYFRGSLAARLAAADAQDRGAMISVQLSESELHPYMRRIAPGNEDGRLSIGCENSPSSTTVTGLETSVNQLKCQLDRDGIFNRKLKIPVAYHSSHMQIIAAEYAGLLESICRPGTPILTEVPVFISSVTGDSVSLEKLCCPEYWVRNLVSKVRFSEAVRRLHSITSKSRSKNEAEYFVEIGPHAALQRPIKDILQENKDLLYDPTLRRGLNSLETLANLAGRLFVQGYPMNLEKTNTHRSANKPPKMLTGLPKYPFNHSQRYWLESRLFRNYRQRDRIRHELLGLPSTDWNPLRPRWRHTLRVSDLPWLGEHKVNGSVVYPAAGILAMVIEAVRSISKPGSTIRGYRFREVIMLNALVIPSATGALEVQLYMQNQKNSRTTGISSIECREFCISSYLDNEWRDACSGTIVTEYEENSVGIYDSQGHALKSGDHVRARFNEILQHCPETTSQQRFYKIGRKMGYHFGPSFQTLQEIAYDPAGGYAVGSVILDEWVMKSPGTSTYMQKHVIHPTALDSVLQIVAAMTTKGGSILGPLHAPTQFRELWISNDLLSKPRNSKLRVAVKMLDAGARITDTSIIALHSETSEPAILIENYQLTTISSDRYTPSKMYNKMYTLEWKPDVDLLYRSEKEEYCLRETGMDIDWNPSRNVVCIHHMTQALLKLEEKDIKSLKPHLQKYLGWMRRYLNGLGDTNPLLGSPWKESFTPENKDGFLTQFAATGPVERATHLFCSQLADIVKGEVDPLDLLFNQGLAKDLYSDNMIQVTGKRVAAFVDLLAHKSPNMNILEIGAGTGSITGSVLSSLSRHEQSHATPKYSSYAFTDISPSFFEKAREKFADHASRMSFKMLNIEQDPASQGFELGTYDLVLAAMVLHATASIQDTLRNAKSLLKPGGYLILVEPVNKDIASMNAIWGTLPGWWRGVEKDREWSPLYTQSDWDENLQRSGFTGIELALPDRQEVDRRELSFFVSRVKKEAALTDPGQVCRRNMIIVAADTELQQKVAIDIASYTESAGLFSCEIVSLSSTLELNHQNTICVSILELENSFLSSMGEIDFITLKNIVDSSSQIYWISTGGGSGARQPEKAMFAGFGRAIMQEHPGLRVANIDVEEPMAAAETFRRVFEQISPVSDIGDWESDFLHSDGVVAIPRVVEATDVNNFVHSQTGQLDIEKRTVGEAATEALKLEFTFGHLDSFRFTRDETFDLPLAEDEVEIEVKASGINFIDVMAVLGQLTSSSIGHECSGIVSRVGSAVTSLSLGDRVCCTGVSTFRTFFRGKEHATIRIPDTLPFTEAFPVIYLTVIYSISHLGRLRKGESILIHTAAGAVGQAAIQLAQRIGADIFVTVSSPEKESLIRDLYGIPENRIFFSRNLSFGDQIRQATNGRGVDVVLNSLSGEGLVESWRTLAPLGRFIEIGKRDIQSFQSLPMQPFSKNISYHSVDLAMMSRHRPGIIKELMTELEGMLSDGIFSTPRPLSVFSRAEFESAIRYLQTGHHMGKAVVDWEAEAEISLIPSPDPEYSFDPNASYLISGGLGGIGRSLALWFAKRGAKYLILLSRSGPWSEKAIKLLHDLASSGIKVATPQCDVSDAESLRKALSSMASIMPPIKGCIQSSLVLKDRLLENMTLEEWKAVLAPKVGGTWNLHHALPRNMDFFVILSSLGGMLGTRGQSQYNAASTFQDAFARHRWSLGEKCISIDVGVVLEVGYVAEHDDLERLWNEERVQVLHEKELHSVVDWACNPVRATSSSWSTQIITAAGMPDTMERRDVDSIPHLKRPLYRHLLETNEPTASTTQEQAGRVNYGSLLRNAKDSEEAGGIIAAALADKLSRALAVPQEDIEMTRPTYSFGVDSLVAVELRFWFANEVKADISVFDILSNDSVLVLAHLAAKKSQHVQERLCISQNDE